MIEQMKPWFDDAEAQALSAYMANPGYLTEFKHTEAFEQAIAAYTGAKHAIAVNNGTISLTLALIAVGVKAGDEVIVPNYTMIATPNSAKLIGAEPVFVDVEPETLCIDINQIDAAITAKTKAIILVSANGRAPTYGIEALKTKCRQHNLHLIEDSAQSLGSFYGPGQHIGLSGEIGSLSFSAPKIITTGQGGMLLTNNDDIAHKIRRLKDFGRGSGGTDIHDSIGYNFKFTELQAIVGIEQSKKLPSRVARKKEIWQRYAEGLQGLTSIKLFDHDLDLQTPWFIDILVEDRDALAQALLKNNIKTRVMYPPINAQQAYSKPGYFPVSEMIGKHGLWLPSYTQLTDEEIQTICAAVKQHYQ